MSLTVRLKNVGVLKQAEFSLGDLTIICGKNNTGKTYATYALYGFLRSLRSLIDIPIDNSQIRNLFSEKVIKIRLTQTTNQILSKACEAYTNRLDEFFAASEGTFQNSEFHLFTDEIDLRQKEFNGRVESPQGASFIISKRKGAEDLTLTLEIEKEIDDFTVRKIINFVVTNAIFSDSLPAPFISSAERTGIAIFRKELNFARNRLLEEMWQAEKHLELRELLFKSYQSYPAPVESNVAFAQQLEDITKRRSFIAKEHPEVLEDFADIVGGDYVITQQDQLYFIPKDTRLKLTIPQSSSTVCSLLDLSFYLHHIAEEGDLLMVDGPESSLHPENQRRIARLFARLVNLGVKVFITTHSDYIVKELNTLIMLNHDKPHLKRIAEENGYQKDELITAEQVKVYVAEKALLPLEEGQKRRQRGDTLVPADVHPEFGIGVPSFDSTIDEMNRIQDEIVWEEE